MSAGNIKLNLKEFKHVSSDKDSTTLEHKKGHKLVLAHNSLSPESQEQLKALAKGGKAHYDEGGGVMDSIRRSGWAGEAAQATQKVDDAKASPITTSISSSSAGPDQQRAKGGKIQKYADGSSDVGESTMDKVKDFMSHTFQSAEENQQKNQDPRARPIFNGTLEMPKKQPQQKADGGYIKQIHPDEDEPGYTSQMAEGGVAGGSTPYDLHLPCLNPNCKSHGRPHPNCRCYGMAKGGEVNNLRYCAHGMPHMMGCEYAKGGEVSQQGNDVRHAMKDKQRGNSGAAQQQIEFAKSEAKGRAEFERHVKPNIKGLKDGGDPKDADALPDEDQRTQFERLQQNEVDQDPTELQNNQSMESEDAMNAPDQQTQQAAPMAPEDEQKPQRNQFGQEMQPTPQQAPQQQDDSQYQDLPSNVNSSPQYGKYNPQQDANPIQRFQNQVQQYQAKKQDIQNQGIKDANDWAQDLANGHITPLTYEGLFEKKDTVGKIGTLFGLLLSGAGSGLSHQPNAVLGMMQQEIQNDLQAQLHSKVNAQNYLRLAQQNEMNKANINHLDAETNSKAIATAESHMNWSGLHKIITNVNAMPEGQKKNDAKAALAVMNQQIQQGNFNIWDKQASAAAAVGMIGLGKGQSADSEASFQQSNRIKQSGILGPQMQEIGKYDESHHVPGFSQPTSRPPDKEDISKIEGHQNLDKSLSYLKQNIDKYATLNHLDPNYDKGLVEITKLQADLRNGVLGTVYKPSEQPILDQLVNMPAAQILDYKTKAKLDQLKVINNRDYNTKLKSLGLPPVQETKTYKGVTYTRGANGQPIPIKQPKK